MAPERYDGGGLMVEPTSTAEVAELLHGTSTPWRIVGSGQWLQGGGPFAVGAPLATRRLRGVIEYIPGDLVITVGAGTTMAELAEITAEFGQMFAITPYGTPDATIGSVVATGSAGPLALDHYTVRDLVLGLTVVTGMGEVLRLGGRVVKNVAGFDLVRLQAGAWGTLGVITEVSLRLHAIPALDLIYRGRPTVPSDQLLPRLIANRTPLPMLLRHTPDQAPQLWARVSGNRARAEALATQLQNFGVDEVHAEEHTRAALERLCATPGTTVVARARGARSDAVAVVQAAHRLFPDAVTSYDPHRGSLRLMGPRVAEAAAPFAAAAREAGAEHSVAFVVDQGRTASPTPDRLSAQIKMAFDPQGWLNRRVNERISA